MARIRVRTFMVQIKILHYGLILVIVYIGLVMRRSVGLGVQRRAGGELVSTLARVKIQILHFDSYC